MPVISAAQAFRRRDIPDDQLDADERLKRRLLSYISMSDKHEEARRKTDRVGGNLKYSKHWQVAVSDRRAALTVNVAGAIIDHKISIMTKQNPTPVIEATDFGDEEAARKLRSCVIDWWKRRKLQGKLERVLNVACCTRSAALKWLWDPTLHGGAGDIDVDVKQGWKLIVDPRVSEGEQMQFAGDREMVPRARAMLLYPKAAKRIKEAPSARQSAPSANAAGAGGSPIKDPWQKLYFDYPVTAIVNGTPTLLSYSGQSPTHPMSSDLVQIVELYIRDYTMFPVKRRKRDKHGQVVQKAVVDPDTGMPQFRLTGTANHSGPDGSTFTTPTYELLLEDVWETKDERKYPWWRRITMLLPDAEIIDDCAWDYRLPYAYFHDGEALDGFWVKGSLLELETLQGAFNVSLSTMLDNLRFSAYRAYLAYAGSLIEKNTLNISPGEIIRVGEKGTFEPFPVVEVAQAWFGWCEFIISLMEKVIGAQGIMQGEAAGRVDSAAGYDMLAEIGGSRLVKCTQRMERSIAELIEGVAQCMQRHYDEDHAVRVEDEEGNESFERLIPGTLDGTFAYSVLTGSSLAWSETAVRQRVLEELQEGLRDKVSAWKALHIDDWRSIMARLLKQPPQLGVAPPPRTRQSIPANPSKPKAPRGATAAAAAPQPMA